MLFVRYSLLGYFLNKQEITSFSYIVNIKEGQMNTRNNLLLIMAISTIFILRAQKLEITGVVSSVDGVPLAGATISIKGTAEGSLANFDGRYSIVANKEAILVIAFLGFISVEKIVGEQNIIDVQLMEDYTRLEEVVVTALGILREKKSLGYATQEVTGAAITKVKTQNFINSLSGRVAGLDIRTSGTLGGSVNVVIRGNNSLAGDNQALFVVNGVPINNDTGNTGQQRFGFGGYDYGNAASDINPEDIETINVLKGAAATALYGSRASNGVIMITTKKGSKQAGIGISFSSSVTLGNVDKSTLPVYQKIYGAGYGPYYDGPGNYFGLFDINGDGQDDLTTVFTEDASYGAAFDPNLLIYQWNSLYSGLETYLQPTPWIGAKNDPNYIWKNSATVVNSLAFEGANEQGSFRVGVSNFLQDGNLPNSELKRNTIDFSATYKLIRNLTASGHITFTKTDGKGRYGTGYDGNNEMIAFRQYWQVNVDLKEQESAYLRTRENATWNPSAPDNTVPIYANNAYWTFYENYATDTRNRFFGNFVLEYQITDWLRALGRFTFDTYDELREERTAVGSVNIPGYIRRNRNISEYNYDLILNFNKTFSKKWNFLGTLGFNLRRNEWNILAAETSDGLLLPELYTLNNSVGPVITDEYEAVKMVDGIYAQASIGYNFLAYLEGTYRRDRSSSLPKNNNTYDYWSVTGSLIFSQLLKTDWLSFGKLRANYGVVGNDTDPYRIIDTYNIITPPFNGGLASNPGIKNNPNLRPEEQRNWEIGLEAFLFDRRFGFDLSYYDNRNIDQITQVPVSNSTGFRSALLNAGTIENKGWEVQLSATPLKLKDFNWDLQLNWAKNKSLVVELLSGIENLEISFFQEGGTLNATPGQPYGTIRGTNYVFHENGQPIVDEFGFYLISDTSNEVIGNINPDWTAGLFNSFTYKNINLSFLLDMRQGGDLYSLDTFYGFSTGIYDFSAGDNELGNPVRDPVTNGPDSGGVLLNGVNENGTLNEIRADASSSENPLGWNGPSAQHIYDAGFIKLREASLTYNFSEKQLDKLPFTQMSFSIIGRNLWIIDKNIPYSDPEAGISAGNIQGYQVGAYPAIKEMGISLQMKF